MNKPPTHSNNFIVSNSHTISNSKKEPSSPKHIIQDIMYTPHQHSSSVTALHSKNKHSKHFAMYTHNDNNNNNNNNEFKRQVPQSHITKIKKLHGYMPSKFDNINDNKETIKLVKSYSGSYNMSQIRSSNALAKVVSQVKKQPNNYFFLNKNVSVNETLQRNNLQKIKMSYIQNSVQHNNNNNLNTRPINSNNANTNTNTPSMIYADNNNNSSSKIINNKHHSSNRNNHNSISNNNNLLLINNNHHNVNENDKNINSLHYNQCENSSKVPSKSALENYPQGSSVCFVRTSNSDTIKTRKKFNKSKTKRKTQKLSPNHIEMLNMKDVLDEIQNEDKQIKICKTIHKNTVTNKEEQNDNKTLILTTINDNSNNKGFFCKCIPFCIHTDNKTIK